MKTLTNTQFKQILENISSIDYELDFDGYEGTYETEDYLLEVDPFSFNLEFSVSETGYLTPETYYQPSEWVSNGKSLSHLYFDLYNEDGEEIELSEEQSKEFYKIIESIILN